VRNNNIFLRTIFDIIITRQIDQEILTIFKSQEVTSMFAWQSRGNNLPITYISANENKAVNKVDSCVLQKITFWPIEACGNNHSTKHRHRTK
jgi:hypothetical protein